jgi:Predicted membrane protein (DUF2142)
MITRFTGPLHRHAASGVPILVLLFVLFALPTSLFLAFAVPPGEVPDEPTHVARAGSLLHGELIGQRRPSTDGGGRPIMNSGVVTNPGPVDATFGFQNGTIKKMTVADLARLEAIGWGPKLVYFATPNVAVYFPVFYVPMAIGLGFGHVMHTTPLGALVIARVASALTVTLLGVLALSLARRGRLLLFATLTLPMTLWLAGSCNEDGVLIGTACLAAALLSRARRPRGWSYWTAAVLLACVIAVKPPYLPMAAALLLPWREWRRDSLPALGGVLLAAVPGLVWGLFAMHVASGVFVFGPPYHPGPLYPGDPKALFSGPDTAAQVQVFLHDPWRLFTMPLQAFERPDNAWVPNSMIGWLGPLDVIMPTVVYYWWWVALSCAALGSFLASPREASGPRIGVVAVVLLAVLATVLAIYDLQYLSWTQVGWPAITGVQGRYALPLMAMLAVSLPLIRFPGAATLRGVLTFPVLCLACVGMVYLPQLVVTTYYLR